MNNMNNTVYSINDPSSYVQQSRQSGSMG